MGNATCPLRATPHPDIAIGTRVMMHGLIKRPSLNGQFATVVGRASDSGRFQLQSESGSQTVQLVKRMNFTAVAGLDLQASAVKRGDCVVCLTGKKATCTAVPCGHLASCQACASAMPRRPQCPVCRVAVDHFMTVFVSAGADEERILAAERKAAAADAALASAEKQKAEAIEKCGRASSQASAAERALAACKVTHSAEVERIRTEMQDAARTNAEKAQRTEETKEVAVGAAKLAPTDAFAVGASVQAHSSAVAAGINGLHGKLVGTPDGRLKVNSLGSSAPRR